MEGNIMHQSALQGQVTLSNVYKVLEEGKTLGIQNGVDKPYNYFWKDEWLSELNYVIGTWWPKDAPPRFSVPDVHYWFKMYWHEPSLGNNTFKQLLDAQALRCVEWLQSEKRNPQNPNETKEERARRKARERVARYRDNKKQQFTPEVQAELESLDISIATLKRKMQTQVETLRQEGAALHERIVAVAQQRKAIEVQYAAEIDAAKAQRELLTKSSE